MTLQITIPHLQVQFFARFMSSRMIQNLFLRRKVDIDVVYLVVLPHPDHVLVGHIENIPSRSSIVPEMSEKCLKCNNKI
jgi:hypothetical protein